MQDQSALGGKQINRLPGFNSVRQARVTSTKDFYTYGRIQVVFLDYSQPMPVWVVGDIDREPVSGDMVLIGYMDGRKDAPYLVGFVKNNAYTTNFIVVRKDKIKLQLPVFDIGVKNGTAHKDVQSHLLDNTKQNQRAYVELTPDHALISFPTSKDGSTPPAVITVTKDNVSITHPSVAKVQGGTQGAARVGDTVEVTVGGVTGTGTITSGSTKTLIG